VKYIVIEDELLTANRLVAMMQELEPDAQHLATLESVSAAVAWIKNNPTPHLAFFDIQLADGLSFEIFEQVETPFPVIFTTAYNEYAIKAFKVNSIDYLLKPLNSADLKQALAKFSSGFYAKEGAGIDNQSVAKVLSLLSNSYKTRFLVKVGEHIRMVAVDDIAMIFSSDKSTFIRTKNGRDYGIDYSLDQLDGLINPATFFRVSRKFIVSIDAIADIITYSGSRLKLKLVVETDDDVLVSREKVAEFKNWLDR